ncbi:MAG: DALR domain-containing protein, partial [Anaerolineae bacterium]
MALRLFYLSAHYRSPLDFTEEAMQAATAGLERLRDVVAETRWRLERAPEGPVSPSVAELLEQAKARFEEAMDDDFNTPQALAALFDLTREVNALFTAGRLTKGDLQAIDDLYRRLAEDVLGLVLDPVASASDKRLIEGLIQVLVDLRQEYRAAKDWARADALRERLAALGVDLLDGPEGTRWRLTRR